MAESAEQLEISLKSARARRDVDCELQVLTKLAKKYYTDEKYRESLRHLKSAATLHKNSGNKDRQFKILLNISQLQETIEEFDGAIETLFEAKALDIDKGMALEELTRLLHSRLPEGADVYVAQMGELIEYSLSAVTDRSRVLHPNLIWKVQLWAGTAPMLHNLALIFEQRNEWDRVIVLKEKQVVATAELKDGEQEATCHRTLAYAYYNTEKYEESLSAMRKACDLFQSFKNHSQYQLGISHIGRTLEKMGRSEEAASEVGELAKNELDLSGYVLLQLANNKSRELSEIALPAALVLRMQLLQLYERAATAFASEGVTKEECTARIYAATTCLELGEYHGMADKARGAANTFREVRETLLTLGSEDTKENILLCHYNEARMHHSLGDEIQALEVTKAGITRAEADDMCASKSYLSMLMFMASHHASKTPPNFDAAVPILKRVRTVLTESENDPIHQIQCLKLLQNALQKVNMADERFEVLEELNTLMLQTCPDQTSPAELWSMQVILVEEYSQRSLYAKAEAMVEEQIGYCKSNLDDKGQIEAMKVMAELKETQGKHDEYRDILNVCFQSNNENLEEQFQTKVNVGRNFAENKQTADALRVYAEATSIAHLVVDAYEKLDMESQDVLQGFKAYTKLANICIIVGHCHTHPPNEKFNDAVAFYEEGEIERSAAGLSDLYRAGGTDKKTLEAVGKIFGSHLVECNLANVFSALDLDLPFKSTKEAMSALKAYPGSIPAVHPLIGRNLYLSRLVKMYMSCKDSSMGEKLKTFETMEPDQIALEKNLQLVQNIDNLMEQEYELANHMLKLSSQYFQLMLKKEGVIQVGINNLNSKSAELVTALSKFEAEMADVYQEYANCLCNTGQYKEARRQCQLALKLVSEKSHEAVIYGTLGKVYHKIGDRKQAVEYYERMLKLASETESEKGSALELGKDDPKYFDSAREKLARAFHLSEQLGDIAQARAAGNLANLDIVMNKLEEAEREHEHAMKIYNKHDMKHNHGTAHQNLGVIAMKMGKEEKALKHFQEAHEIGEMVTALHLAAEHGHLEVVEMLHNFDAMMNVETTAFESALELALINGHSKARCSRPRARHWERGAAAGQGGAPAQWCGPQVVTFLKDDVGVMPFLKARCGVKLQQLRMDRSDDFRWSDYHEMAWTGRITEDLSDYQDKDFFGRTTFHIACFRGHVKWVNTRLRSCRTADAAFSTVAKADGQGWTALHWACAATCKDHEEQLVIEVVKSLMDVVEEDKKRVLLNRADHHGYTPLQIAHAYGNNEIYNLLKEEGASFTGWLYWAPRYILFFLIQIPYIIMFPIIVVSFMIRGTRLTRTLGRIPKFIKVLLGQKVNTTEKERKRHKLGSEEDKGHGREIAIFWFCLLFVGSAWGFPMIFAFFLMPNIPARDQGWWAFVSLCGYMANIFIFLLACFVKARKETELNVVRHPMTKVRFELFWKSDEKFTSFKRNLGNSFRLTLGAVALFGLWAVLSSYLGLSMLVLQFPNMQAVFPFVRPDFYGRIPGMAQIFPLLFSIFLPVSTVFFQALDCTYNSDSDTPATLDISPDIECWQGNHRLYAMLAMSCQVYFIPSCAIYGTHFLEHDTDTCDVRLIAKYMMLENVAKWTISMVNTFFSTKPDLAPQVTCLVCMSILSYANLVWQPCKRLIYVNLFRGLGFALVAWQAFCYTYAMFVIDRDIGEPYNEITELSEAAKDNSDSEPTWDESTHAAEELNNVSKFHFTTNPATNYSLKT
eukprot:gene1852-2524_t